jgi:hypothetical protein
MPHFVMVHMPGAAAAVGMAVVATMVSTFVPSSRQTRAREADHGRRRQNQESSFHVHRNSPISET